MKKIIAFKFLTSSYFVLFMILFCGMLNYFTGALGFIIGIIVALVAVWMGGFSWTEFGIAKPAWIKTFVIAIVLAISIVVVSDGFIQPFISKFFGAPKVESFSAIRGNLKLYIEVSVLGLVMGGFAEEFFYRGYLMKRLAIIFGDNNMGWLFSGIIISIIFGISHKYQGVPGMISTGIVGFIYAMIFYYNRQNLVLVILTHGFNDFIIATLTYLGKETMLADLMHKYI